MKRLTILLLTVVIVGTMCLAIATSSSTNKDAVSSPPISAAPVQPQQEQDAPGVIKGADNPDLIPDHMAFSVIFRLLSNAQTDVEKQRARAYLRRMGLGVQACKNCPTAATPEARERDIDAFLNAASEFKQQVSVLDEQARDIRTHNRSAITPSVMARLTKLQKQKEIIVWRIVASLPSRLTSDGITLLRQRVKEHVKRNIKVTPKGA
jgi:hypothetical protein